jgi:ribosomal protein S18 acetylase RimI-like enzyme
MKQGIIKNVKIRHVAAGDLDACFTIESTCYTTDAATREKIEKRIAIFPAGFLVAEVDRQVVGMINSGATNKDDITDDAFKGMADHIHDGKHIVIFSLAVLPAFQGVGISRMLMEKFIEASRDLEKEKILLMCKSGLISYYLKYGFLYAGKSKSTLGGFEWHEMYLPRTWCGDVPTGG